MVVRVRNLALTLGLAVTACSGGGDATSTTGDTDPPDDGFDRSALTDIDEVTVVEDWTEAALVALCEAADARLLVLDGLGRDPVVPRPRPPVLADGVH